MANWKKRINIHAILRKWNEEFEKGSANEDEIAVSCAKELFDLLTSRLSEYPFLDGFEYATNQDELNEALDNLYDWADDNLVWLGI